MPVPERIYEQSEEAAPAEPEIVSAEPEPHPPAGGKEHAGGRGDSLLVLGGLVLAFIVILIAVGGFIAYFQLYASSSKTSDYCLINASIQCANWVLGSSGELELELANGYSEDLYLDEFACSNAAAPSLKKLGVKIKSGETASVRANCVNADGSPAGGLTGELFEAKLYARYHLQGEANASRSADGLLRTRRKTLS